MKLNPFRKKTSDSNDTEPPENVSETHNDGRNPSEIDATAPEKADDLENKERHCKKCGKQMASVSKHSHCEFCRRKRNDNAKKLVGSIATAVVSAALLILGRRGAKSGK